MMKPLIHVCLVLAIMIIAACGSKHSSSPQPQKPEKERIDANGQNEKTGNDGKTVTTPGTVNGPGNQDPGTAGVNAPQASGIDGDGSAAGMIVGDGVSANGADGGIAIATTDNDGKSTIFVSNGGTVTVGNDTVTAPADGCIAVVDGRKTEGKTEAECDKLQLDLGIDALILHPHQ